MYPPVRRIFPLIVCVATLAQAQATRDYSVGFDRLFQLGLPDVADAEYVNLSIQNQHQMGAHNYQWQQIGLSGNAWLLAEPDEHRTRYLVNEGREIEVYEPGHLQRLRSEEAAADDSAAGRVHLMMMQDGRFAGTAQPADLAEDLETLLAHIKELTAQGNRQRHALTQIDGQVFIYAALAHRHGYPDEAAALLDALFEMTDEPRQTIMRGMGHLADQQYSTLFAEWRRDGDWEAYHAGLHPLGERFRAAWQLAPAAEQLRERLAFRIDHPEPPPIEGLSDGDQAVARDLATAASPKIQQQHGVWIFPHAQYLYGVHGMSQDTDHPLARIKARGREAIPLLLAMLDDEYLTAMPFNAVAGSSMHFGFHSHSRMSEEMQRQMFDTFPRPATRSDVSRVLLHAIVQQEQHRNVWGKTVDEIRYDTEQWLERYGDLSLEEIAVDYLRDGTNQHRAMAGTFLLHSGEKAHRQHVEDAIREAVDPLEITDLALTYAHVVGAEGHELIDAYRKQLRDQLDHMDDQQEWKKRQIERTLTQLERLLSDETLTEYLAALKEQPENMDAENLMRLAARGPKRQAVGELLTAAQATDDASLRVTLLSVLQHHDYWQHSAPGGIHIPMQTQAPDAPIGEWVVEDHRDIWTALLDDDRAGQAMHYMAAQTPVGSVAAQSLLAMLDQSGTAGATYGILSWQTGARATGFFVDWATARLDDPDLPLPTPPTAQDVDADARAAMRSRLMDADGDELVAQLDALGPAELLALQELLGRDDDLAAHLLPAANRIVRVNPHPGAEVNEAIEAELQDAVLNRALVERAFDLVHQAGIDGTPLAVIIQRPTTLDGITITYGPPRQGTWAWQQPTSGQHPHMRGQVAIGQKISERAKWPLATPQPDDDPEEPEPLEGDDLDLLGEMLADLDERQTETTHMEQTSFWAAVEALPSADTAPQLPGWILFYTDLPDESATHQP